MTRLTIRIDFAPDAAFGPGKARLLELVEETGSIRRAAAGMGMSYRRAWLLLKDIEAVIGAPAVQTRTGGAKGGGSALSPSGHAMLKRYREIEKRAARSVSRELAGLTGLARKARLQRSGGRR
ncbi:MAG TPA: LysR family transcriptional regulator [Rhizomicrobium sp.]|nr:LysR family transcriptional regulator [Rhizomicrobium sp.]